MPLVSLVSPKKCQFHPVTLHCCGMLAYLTVALVSREVVGQEEAEVTPSAGL